MLYDTNSSPYGKSYAEWINLWWKWLISIPINMNPAFDPTGQFSTAIQNNSKVCFLAGTFGGPANRSCVIPHGKAILFPVINYECSFADAPSIDTESGLERRCKQEMDEIGDMKASLDGERIDIHKYRVHSRCFTVNIPPNNCLGAVSGTTRISSDGYWLFIRPLPPGHHVLRSFGSCMSGKIRIGCTFQLVIK